MYDTTDLTTRGAVATMIETYNREVERIKAAYAELQKAQDNLDATFGNPDGYYSRFQVLTDRRHNPSDAVNVALTEIKGTAWRQVANLLEVRKQMSEKRTKDFDEKMSNPDKLPELTLDAAYDLLKTLIDNVGTFNQEAIDEAYDFLRPSRAAWEKPYKTNEKNATEHIGKKVIMSWIVEANYSGGLRVKHGSEARLTTLDRVFHFLDGKAMTDGYKSPLVDAINTAKDGCGETAYFRFKAYWNGNLHVEFKRADLLQEFNARAGGMNLKSGTLF